MAGAEWRRTEGSTWVGRLANGDTVMSLSDPGELVEVDHAGKVVRSIGGTNPAVQIRLGFRLCLSTGERSLNRRLYRPAHRGSGCERQGGKPVADGFAEPSRASIWSNSAFRGAMISVQRKIATGDC